MARAFAALALGLSLALGLAGCERSAENPPRLRFSAIPDQTPGLVRAQHQQVVDRVCASAKMACEWVPVEGYEALVDRLGRGEIDVAYCGAVTFVQAWHRHGAVPLAMRDIDFRFSSVIVVRRSSNAQNLDDLKNVRFTFGNRSSTSSHVMLRQRLLDQSIVPERYFSAVGFTSNHDETMRAVAGGGADAGGVNASVFYGRLAAGDPAARSLRVVWQSPPFTDYVWAARRQLSAPLRQALVDAFLDLDLVNAADRPALLAEGANGYVPAFPEDFEEARGVLAARGEL
jgi:phosphonate transport system substrate-binding protein